MRTERPWSAAGAFNRPANTPNSVEVMMRLDEAAFVAAMVPFNTHVANYMAKWPPGQRRRAAGKPFTHHRVLSPSS